jgi:hypothetical protein
MIIASKGLAILRTGATHHEDRGVRTWQGEPLEGLIFRACRRLAFRDGKAVATRNDTKR